VGVVSCAIGHRRAVSNGKDRSLGEGHARGSVSKRAA